MKNRTKIDAKSKLEKVMPKWCHYDRKWVQNQAQIDPKIDEKKHAKNRSKKYGEKIEKIVGRSGKNPKSSAPGRPTATKAGARQNARGRRGGKEGLKPLRVWQGSWLGIESPEF